MQRSALCLFVLACLLGWGCSRGRSHNTDVPFTLQNHQIRRDLMTIYFNQADSSVIDTAHHTLSIDYPLISDWENREAQQIFNTWVNNLVNENIAMFNKEMVPDDYQEKVWLDSLAAKEYAYTGKSSSLYINYQPGIVNQDFIAIHFAFDAYYGGAHGMQYFQQLNFDVSSKKILTLSDLFKPDADYLNQISQYCRKDLLSRLDEIGSDSSMVLSGTEPELRNFENFELTSQGLKLYFTPYQVAPYASGSQEVKIPYAVLEPILEPDGVWRKISKQANLEQR
ncbi:MAG: DUF3298 domain-containing protein [Cytophagales bacterium]|nr:DUF3298 and DUF4163 domain-containing protein [Bernardetiaceae bacterium]MDW8204563.1 DUF3298 domain-containing protein [Cytophagales bacterium]